MMGFNLATLKIYPIQYISYEEKICFYPHIGFTITFRPSQVEHSHPKRVSEISERFVEDVIRAIVLNPEDIGSYRPPTLSVEKRKGKATITSYPSLEGNCVDYVIITSEELRDSFERLAEYRTKSGLLTRVVTIDSINLRYSGADEEERIRNFLEETYRDWGVRFALLGGDVNVVPTRVIPDAVTDLYYSGLDGTWNEDLDWNYGEGSGNKMLIEPSNSIYFFNANEGVLAANGKIFRTSNAGNSWETVWDTSTLYFKISNFSFYENSGWAILRRMGQSRSWLIKTDDEGYSWYTIGDSLNFILTDLLFLNENDGFAVGYKGVRSTDSVSYTHLTLPTKA